MRKDVAPSGCDVVGWAEPAARSYLHARLSRVLEFGICTGPYARLQNGERPVVVAERLVLAPLGDRHGLVLDRPEAEH